MNFNYRSICYKNLLCDLPNRTKEVLVRRFGLEGERETLEAVGKVFDITRERVRQIEKDGLNKLEKKVSVSACKTIFNNYSIFLENNAGIKKEQLLLSHFGKNEYQNYVFFMLTLGNAFERFSETEDFYAFWTIDKTTFTKAKKVVKDFSNSLKKSGKPSFLPSFIPASYIEISKEIIKGPRGSYGLKEWPEVNPKGVKDKAYIVFKEKEEPLHFNQVASLINSSSIFNPSKTVIPQTVHNELIKDPRFVLVGRGLYALREWGYEPGIVRDIIYKEIKNSKEPLQKDEIIKRVLNQRKVKSSTILLNLQNKIYFAKNSQGGYTIRKV